MRKRQDPTKAAEQSADSQVATPGKRTRTELEAGSRRRSPAANTTDAAAGARAALSGRGAASADQALADAPRSGGRPLDTSVARGVQRATGESLGDVRVHTGSASARAADALGARAFTTGSDIHLGRGSSPSDARLMSHEAAHTVQQRGVSGGPQRKPVVSEPGDRFEAEADRVADAALSGDTAQVTPGAAGGIQRDVVSDVEENLSYSLFDWAITDAEALEAFEQLTALQGPALGAALGRLDQKYKTRLLDNLPAAARSLPDYSRLLCAMGPSALRRAIEGLLSYGVFDWAITDEEMATITTVFETIDPEQARRLYVRLSSTFKHRFIDNLSDLEKAKTLFEIRFNHPIVDAPDGSAAWTLDVIKEVWRQLDVLPASDVSESTILTTFQAMSGGGGLYGGGVIELGVGETNAEELAHTVRHEVAHGVHDQIPGPVNTWLQNDIDFFPTDLDTWIDELGGFPSKYEHPTDGEKSFDDDAKTAVRDLIDSYMNDEDWGPTRTDVDTDASDVEKAQWAAMPEGVREACAKSVDDWYDHWRNFQQAGGKRYFLNHWYHAPYSFGAGAAAAIETTGDDYTAMSEFEFFANCYAEYFKDPEGFDDHSKWGGGLSGSVQDFFTTCVVERHPYSDYQKSQAKKKT